MKKLAILAAAATLMAISHSAQAQIVVGSATWVNTASGSGGTPALTVSYEVFDNSGVYTYDYTLNVAASNPVDGFSVDASYVLPGTVSVGGAAAGGVVAWNLIGVTDPVTVSFKSDFAPSLGGGSAYDGSPSVAWSAGFTGDSGTANGLIAVPVPEASTVMAGALMLLPLGIGAVRAIRKDRTV
jgi:hypothetical protein